ncbi:DUF945 family protein [Orbaceae bacterium ac157xtp]
MKKTKVAGIMLGLLAIGYVGSSWYMGTKIESIVDEQFTNINQQLNELNALIESGDNLYSAIYGDNSFTVSYDNYERGVFSSTFDLHVTVNNNRYGSNDEVLNKKMTIYHGPLSWNSITNGHFTPHMADLSVQIDLPENDVVTVSNGNTIYTANMFINFDNSIDLVGKSKPFKIIKSYYNKNNYTQLEFSKSTLKTSINKSYFEKINFSMGNIKFEDKTSYSKNIVNVNDIDLELHTNVVTILEGIIKTNLTINNIDININDNKSKIDHIISTNDVIIKDYYITNESELSIKNILVGGHNLGKFEMSGSTQHLFDQLDGVDMTTPNGWLNFIKNPLLNLIKYNISNISLKNKKGILEGNLNITFNEDYQAINFDIGNIQTLTSHLSLPMEPLAYFVSQIKDIQQNTNKSKISDDDIANTKEELKEYFILFNDNSSTPLIMNDDGIFMDLDFNENSDEATINGKQVNSNDFWKELRLKY